MRENGRRRRSRNRTSIRKWNIPTRSTLSVLGNQHARRVQQYVPGDGYPSTIEEGEKRSARERMGRESEVEENGEDPKSLNEEITPEEAEFLDPASHPRWQIFLY